MKILQCGVDLQKNKELISNNNSASPRGGIQTLENNNLGKKKKKKKKEGVGDSPEPVRIDREAKPTEELKRHNTV